MSVNVRWDQCCESDGCTKPALHGALCAACFLAATPARRAVELLDGSAAERLAAPPGDEPVDAEGVLWLRRLWAA
jgi:hypothetical protein